jgi:hypothetical protein
MVGHARRNRRDSRQAEPVDFMSSTDSQRIGPGLSVDQGTKCGHLEEQKRAIKPSFRSLHRSIGPGPIFWGDRWMCPRSDDWLRNGPGPTVRRQPTERTRSVSRSAMKCGHLEEQQLAIKPSFRRLRPESGPGPLGSGSAVTGGCVPRENDWLRNGPGPIAETGGCVLGADPAERM